MAKTTGKTNGRAAGSRASKADLVEIGSDGRPLPRSQRTTGSQPDTFPTVLPSDGRLGSGILMGSVTASQADVTDELEKGGPAFGAFVKSIGEAVAAAQTQLDANLTATARKLSDTNIDVIAVFEQVIDDNGELVSGNPIKMKLPLINYLMPTAYQWSRVFLQADLNVSEFNGANGFNIQGKHESTSVRGRAGYSIFGGFGASGSVAHSSGSYSQEAEASFSRDSAAGKLHLEATLEPRADVQLPKPYILQKGPKLKLVAGSRTDVMNTANPPEAVGRKVVVTAELLGSPAGGGGPLAGKKLEFKVNDPSVDYKVTTANGVTDNGGNFAIELARAGAAFDPSKPPQPVLIRVWFGLVSQDLGLSI